MVKDLEQEFLQGRMNKAKNEIAKTLEKYQLLLSAEMSYTQGGILPIIKLVDNSKAANKPKTEAEEVKEGVEVAREVAEETSQENKESK